MFAKTETVVLVTNLKFIVHDVETIHVILKYKLTLMWVYYMKNLAVKIPVYVTCIDLQDFRRTLIKMVFVRGRAKPFSSAANLNVKCRFLGRSTLC